MLQNSHIEWTLDPRFVGAIEVGKQEYLLRRLPKWVQRLAQGHISTGQRTCLVAAQHINTAEVLNRGQMLDDDLLPCHMQCALSQCHCRNHRQKLWGQPNGQRNSKEQRLKEIALKGDVNEKDKEYQKNHRAHNE